MKLLRATALLVAAIVVGATVWFTHPATVTAGQGQTFVLAIQDLNLTDAQEEKITDIRKESRPKIREAAKELDTLAKEEVEKLKGVLTADQVKKVQEMKEEREDRREDCLAHAFMNLKELDLTESEMAKIGEIRKEFRPKIEKAIKELDGLLTDAQKRNREEAEGAPGRVGAHRDPGGESPNRGQGRGDPGAGGDREDSRSAHRRAEADADGAQGRAARASPGPDGPPDCECSGAEPDG